jgi:quinol monooxygenase YgiN
MHGLILKITAVPDQRDALTTIMLEGVTGTPGCLSYIVAHDPADETTIWVTEVWTDEAAYRTAYEAPKGKAVLAKAMPLIATFGEPWLTTPVGGVGLVQP